MEDANIFGSEIREDYRSGFYSIMVPKRHNRPEEIREESTGQFGISQCPFEPANDSMASEIARYGNPWQVKVIENKYPELSGNTPFGETTDKDGLLKSVGGYGYNEVLIDSQIHTDIFEAMPLEKLKDWLDALIDREEVLYERRYIKSVLVFKNYGAVGGASLAHPHTQIMAWPLLIGLIKRESDVSRHYKENHGDCLYEKIYETERGRLLLDNDSFFAVAPFGSRTAAESMIVPKRHVNYIGDLSDTEKTDFVSALRSVLLTNRKIYGNQAYNFVIHEIKDYPDFHMHLEIYPRLSTLGGIELGENVFVNIILPEDYAEEFRKSITSSN